MLAHGFRASGPRGSRPALVPSTPVAVPRGRWMVRRGLHVTSTQPAVIWGCSLIRWASVSPTRERGLVPASQDLQTVPSSCPPEAPALLVGPGNSWGAAPHWAPAPPPRPGPRPSRPARATSSRWYHKAIPNLGCPGTNSPSRPLPRGPTPLEPQQGAASSLLGVRAATRGRSCRLFVFLFLRMGRESQPGRLRPGQASVRRRAPETAPSTVSSAPSFLPVLCSFSPFSRETHFRSAV